MSPPLTPDKRYLVIAGRAGPRLWRAANPDLADHQRQQWVDSLMDARRAVKAAKDDRSALAAARAAVDNAKRQLGERGPPWWSDGDRDWNRHLIKNTPYRDWWDEQSTSPPQ